MKINISPRSDSGDQEPDSDWLPRRGEDGYKEGRD